MIGYFKNLITILKTCLAKIIQTNITYDLRPRLIKLNINYYIYNNITNP